MTDEPNTPSIRNLAPGRMKDICNLFEKSPSVCNGQVPVGESMPKVSQNPFLIQNANTASSNASYINIPKDNVPQHITQAVIKPKNPFNNPSYCLPSLPVDQQSSPFSSPAKLNLAAELNKKLQTNQQGEQSSKSQHDYINEGIAAEILLTARTIDDNPPILPKKVHPNIVKELDTTSLDPQRPAPVPSPKSPKPEDIAALYAVVRKKKPSPETSSTSNSLTVTDSAENRISVLERTKAFEQTQKPNVESKSAVKTNLVAEKHEKPSLPQKPQVHVFPGSCSVGDSAQGAANIESSHSKPVVHAVDKGLSPTHTLVSKGSINADEKLKHISCSHLKGGLAHTVIVRSSPKKVRAPPPPNQTLHPQKLPLCQTLSRSSIIQPGNVKEHASLISSLSNPLRSGTNTPPPRKPPRTHAHDDYLQAKHILMQIQVPKGSPSPSGQTTDTNTISAGSASGNSSHVTALTNTNLFPNSSANVVVCENELYEGTTARKEKIDQVNNVVAGVRVNTASPKPDKPKRPPPPRPRPPSVSSDAGSISEFIRSLDRSSMRSVDSSCSESSQSNPSPRKSYTNPMYMYDEIVDDFVMVPNVNKDSNNAIVSNSPNVKPSTVGTLGNGSASSLSTCKSPVPILTIGGGVGIDKDGITGAKSKGAMTGMTMLFPESSQANASTRLSGAAATLSKSALTASSSSSSSSSPTFNIKDVNAPNISTLCKTSTAALNKGNFTVSSSLDRQPSARGISPMLVPKPVASNISAISSQLFATSSPSSTSSSVSHIKDNIPIATPATSSLQTLPASVNISSSIASQLRSPIETKSRMSSLKETASFKELAHQMKPCSQSSLWRSCSDDYLYTDPDGSDSPIYMDPIAACRLMALDDTFARNDVEVYVDAEGYAIPYRFKRRGFPFANAAQVEAMRRPTELPPPKNRLRGFLRLLSDPKGQQAEADTPKSQKKKLNIVRQKINQAFAIFRRRPNSGSEFDSNFDRNSVENDSFVDVREIQRRVQYVSTVRDKTHAHIRNARVYEEKIYPQLFECALIVGVHRKKGAPGYHPEIVHKFPELVNINVTIPQFCFPDAEFINPRIAPKQSETYSFVLTNEDGGRVFGYCKRYSVQQQGRRQLEVACIISPVNAFNLYKALLDEIEKCRTNSLDQAQELIASAFGRPLPSPGKSVQIRSMNVEAEVETIVLNRQSDIRLENVDYDQLFSVMGVDKMVKVFSSLLLERKLLFTSSKLSLLSTTIHALVSLLYPFTWEHTYIPVLPPALLEICCSPTPYIIGILSSELSKVQQMPTEELVIIDLDGKALIQTIGDEATILPRKLQKALKTALNMCRVDYEAERSKNLMISEAFIRLFIEVAGHFSDHIITGQDGQKVFEKEEFINAAKTVGIKQFLQWFTETQMFDIFISDHLERSESKTLELFLTRITEYQEEADLAPSLRENVRVLGKKVRNIGKVIKSKLN